MSNYLKGLNTSILLHEENFMALTLKVKTSNAQTHLFHLQGEALRDLMMILQNRLLTLQINSANDQHSLAALIEKASQEMANNLPLIEPQDVEQPDAGSLVSNLSVIFNEHDFKLLLILKNESMHHIRVSDAQIQFIMVAIARVLDNVKNTNLIALLAAGNNYAPVYDAEFNDNGTIDYSVIEIEQWKLDLFSQFFLIIYSIESKDGPEMKFGAVIKAHEAINEEGMDIIAHHFASKSKRLMPYSNELKSIKTTALALNIAGIPSPKDALQPLAEFYKTLNMK